jgi:hypothetical protein
MARVSWITSKMMDIQALTGTTHRKIRRIYIEFEFLHFACQTLTLRERSVVLFG